MNGGSRERAALSNVNFHARFGVVDDVVIVVDDVADDVVAQREKQPVHDSQLPLDGAAVPEGGARCRWRRPPTTSILARLVLMMLLLLLMLLMLTNEWPLDGTAIQ